VLIDPAASLYPTLGFTPAQGQVFVIVNNDGPDPVNGTFNGLPQGANFNLGPYPFEVSYIGKTGNDVTLTSLSGDPFNHAPVAVADGYGATKNIPLSVAAPGVMSNDYDVDLDPITVVLSDAASAQGGTVSVGASGGFVYTPPANFTGTDTFSYIISDGKDATDIATVTITVSDPAGTPTVAVPAEFELQAPRPNPGRGHFEVTFGLPVSGRVRAEVFDAAGREVARLADDEPFAAGYHGLRWDGRAGSGAPAASGIYFLRVRSGAWTAQRKLVMVGDR
jgi:hypothetical protein